MTDKDSLDEFVQRMNELRLEAWGYDHFFESSFHAYVFETIDRELRKLRGEDYDR